MPRYDASTDEDLKNSMQFILEKQFFLAQYRKRKFITDNNVLFNENDADDIKNEIVNLFGCNNMNYGGVCYLYQRAMKKINEAISPCNSAEVDTCMGGIVEKQIIDDLQWDVACNIFKLLQKGVGPYIANPNRCKCLLQSAEITLLVMKLTMISVRYGLLISDLCSYPSEIDITTSIDEKDPSQCRPFFHYSDFDPLINSQVLPEDESLYRKRLLKFQKATNAGNQIDRLEASAAKSALKNILQGSFYSNSTQKRLSGLWIWDQCDSPLTEQKKTKSDAISTLVSPDTGEHNETYKDSLKRELYRVYEVTKKSIATGEIQPIEDGKRKNKE